MKVFTLSEIKKIEKKRSGKRKKVWGIVLVVLALILLEENLSNGSGAATIIDTIIFGGPGLILLYLGFSKTKKWDKYEAAVNQNGNTPIQQVADAVHEPPSKVRSVLQEMINNNFFIGPSYDIEAYINGEYDMLVMTRNGKPLEPLSETIERAEKREASAAEKRNVQDNADIKKIRDAISVIEDEEVKDCLYDLEGSVRKINAKLAKSPELEDTTNIRKLKSFYMPQTLTLIDKYQDGLGSDETLEKIKEALKTCADAFGSIERKLNENDDINTQVDIEVLKRTFEREGLLGSDFELFN